MTTPEQLMTQEELAFRWKISEDTVGKQVQVAGWRVVARPKPFLGVTET